MKRRKARENFHEFLKYSFLILSAFIFLFPLYWMLRTSVMDLGDIFALPVIYFPKEIQLQHYRAAFDVFPLSRYLLNSLFVTSLATFGAIFSSSLCAFGFARINWHMREKVFTVVLSSMLLPSAVTLIPTFLEWHAIGVTDSYIPLIVPYWFGGGAMNIFLLRQFFRTIPKSLDESAVIDGAGYFTVYSRIVLPLSKPVLVVVLMFAFTTSWNDFLNPIIYLNTQNKYTLSIGLQLFMTAFQTSWNQLMAAATIAVIPCVFIFLYSQKYIIEGITFTGMKG